MADSGLNAQRLRRKRFLRVNSAFRKGDLKGFGLMFHAFLIAHLPSSPYQKNWISNLEHVDCSPFDKLLGSGKRLVIRDSEICVFEMFGVFAIQTTWHRHSCD